jgi:prolyl 4-hydroxylase
MSLLTKFWKDNTSPSTVNSIPNEDWPAGNTYTNHWRAPTKMLNLENTNLIGSGEALRKKIWDETQQILQEWTGVDLSPTSLYGVRIYTEGAILAPHVDRNPLVISAIINVAQNVEEDWPLEVIGHDGRAYNVTMEVGDMILYESHSVIHGRPFKLKGEYFANVFCHFEPLGHSLREGQRAASSNEDESLESLYQEAWEKQRQQKQNGDVSIDLNADEMTPYYIVPGTSEEKRWMQTHPRARMVRFMFLLALLHDYEPSNIGYLQQEETKQPKLSLTAHAAAADGDMVSLLAIAQKDPNAIKKVDNNGWVSYLDIRFNKFTSQVNIISIHHYVQI